MHVLGVFYSGWRVFSLTPHHRIVVIFTHPQSGMVPAYSRELIDSLRYSEEMCSHGSLRPYIWILKIDDISNRRPLVPRESADTSTRTHTG